MEFEPTTYEVRELNWQIYTKLGNYEMQVRAYRQAQEFYCLAKELAELLLAEAKTSPTRPDAIHPYVVSHHNLMDAYLSLGDVQEAEAILQEAYNQVVAVMQDQSLPEYLRLESFKALKAISFEIRQFYCDRHQLAQGEALFTQAYQQAQHFLAEFDFISLPPVDNPCPPHQNLSNGFL